MIKAEWTNNDALSAEQVTQTNAPNTLNALDCISRQAAIEAINSHFGFNVEEEYGSAVQEVINSLPSAQSESLTDTEQRIFLAAMGREEKTCKNIDEELPGPYKDSLFKACKEIERKVKKALWTN